MRLQCIFTAGRRNTLLSVNFPLIFRRVVFKIGLDLCLEKTFNNIGGGTNDS